MKCIIQIPCYNEAKTLSIALSALPRSLPGVDTVEWMIIDDGSSDDTSEVAKQCGVDYIVTHSTNKGLAAAFMSGLTACLALGADIIVNTDADNQYNSDDIPALVAPILQGKAEIVIGSRPIAEIKHFSPIKKFLQKLGSKAVRLASKTDVPDAPSGFRAISRTAAAKLNVYNAYTYTLETIIQAGQTGIPITTVPVRVNDDLRPSRLVKSISSYVRRSIATIVRIFILYRPLLFFTMLGIFLFGFGLLLGLRFLYFWLSGLGDGHIQSLILSSIFLLMGSGSWMMGIIADLLSTNRRLLEDIRSNMLLRGSWGGARIWRRHE